MNRGTDVPKKVLFVIIDALTADVVDRAIDDGRLPNLARLAELGARRDSTAVFPSITPAATASLATGAYPSEHGIAGAYWMDEQQESVAYYGDDLWVILEEGLDSFLNDFLVTLNYERLRVPGIFQRLEERGLVTACINYLWFRGGTEHAVREPWLIWLIPGVTMERAVHGPRWLQLGDFVNGLPEGVAVSDGGGPLRRYGFNDDRTADALLALATHGLPDFTLAYFPDNDFESHERGPEDAANVLENVDEALGKLFEASGGVEAFLAEAAVVVTGDHSQSLLVEDEEERGIDLATLLGDARVGKGGAYWGEGDEFLACPNLRAAQVYCRDRHPKLVAAAAEILLADPRVDQVITTPRPECGRFEVRTADRGRLAFEQTDRADAVRDDYGNSWAIDGDLAVVDATTRDGRLVYGDYPNALERIAHAFLDCSGSIWATAHVGFEFQLRGSKLHAAGSHGSLHAGDSTSPLIVAGHGDVPVPERPRSIDVVRLCEAIVLGSD